MYFTLALSLLAALVVLSNQDTPVDCHTEDVLGTWNFTLSTTDMPIVNDAVDCSSWYIAQTMLVTLSEPNVAQANGKEGTWTMFYNQGFEVTLDGYKYTVFLHWENTGDMVKSYCHRSEPSMAWYHEDKVNTTHMGCMYARRISSPTAHDSVRVRSTFPVEDDVPLEHPFHDIVEHVNEMHAQGKLSWTAKEYERWEGQTAKQIKRQMGSSQSSPIKEERKVIQRKPVEGPLPESFDWRDHNGQNYVPDVRDQANCGSCYAFGATGMMMSRIRIVTENEEKPNLSTQHVVSCSQYSQKCEGGFPEEVAKFSMDFGLLEEEAYPYQAVNGTCELPEDGVRWYFDDYAYVGGYYGGASDNYVEEMMREIIINGPVAVSIMVYDDFSAYESGVYVHNPDFERYSPTPLTFFEITNHVVLCVGWGHDEELNMDYWIVQNSWGPEWGENGYVRIRKGTDEIAIESSAVGAILSHHS